MSSTRRCRHPAALAHLPRCQVCRVEASPAGPAGSRAWQAGARGRAGSATRGREVCVGQHDDEDGPAGARHVPVALPRVAELLAPALADRPAVLVDATLGLGGHAAALLAEHPQLTLVGLDRDPEALAMARRRLAAHADRIHLVHAVYDRIADVLAELGLPRVDGVLFDLGVSSLQLDADERGFSYSRDADLDMRMDPTTGPDRGRGPQHLPGARSWPGCCASTARSGSPAGSPPRSPAGGRRRRCGAAASWSSCSTRRCPRRPGAPAATRPSGRSRRCGSRSTASWTRCGRRCPRRIDALAVGGRIVVLAYHSLEDRIVKRELAARASSAHAGGPAGRAAGTRAGAAAARPRGGAGERGRDQREPAGGVGAPAGSGTDPGGGVTVLHQFHQEEPMRS